MNVFRELCGSAPPRHLPDVANLAPNFSALFLRFLPRYARANFAFDSQLFGYPCRFLDFAGRSVDIDGEWLRRQRSETI